MLFRSQVLDVADLFSSVESEASPANVSEAIPSTVSGTDESAVEGHTAEGLTVAGIIGQFPLSRRFEFANILFGGDMENMGLFVQEIIDAPSAAARGDVYDRWFEQKQWRRRDESASDMWRMIKRIFTQ